MITRPRVRLAPAGTLAAMSAVALVYAFFSFSGEIRAAAEQPDLPAVANAMARSQVVVVATARSVESAWEENEYGDQIIRSIVLLEVSETLKGRPERSRWLRVEGGTVDGITLEVSGEPEVRVGDRAVFLLDQVRQNLDRPHPVHDSVLPLDDGDFVRGTGVDLETIRRHVRGQGQ